MLLCLDSEPDRPGVLPRARVSPDSAPPSAAFLSALETPPFALQSPPRNGLKKDDTGADSSDREPEQAEAVGASTRGAWAPRMSPSMQQHLVETLVEAFGVLSAADAADRRER